MSASICLPALLTSTEQECCGFEASRGPGLLGRFLCVYVVRAGSGMSSGQRAVVRPVTVRRRVGARRVREHAP